MDSRTVLSRRTALKSAVTIGAVAAVPTLASAADDGRLHELMGAWRTEYDTVNTAAANGGSDIDMNRLWAIEREAGTIRPVTVEGLAIKLLLLTNYGEYDLDGYRAALLVEAETITGYSPPATLHPQYALPD